MKTIGLIQAHHLNWSGGVDYSLATVGGRYVVEHVIERLKAMPELSDIVLAVPEDPGNLVFKQIAEKHGVRCYFGSAENVLERCMGAIDHVGGRVAIHVMGQHCFVDTALLRKMLGQMRKEGAEYISMPDSFTPFFAGKAFTRVLLDAVHAAIEKLPEGWDIQYARFFSFIENHREQFKAAICTDVPRYSEEYLLGVREAAKEIFTLDRQDMVDEKASKVSNSILDVYTFASRFLKPADVVLDIACGDGFGSRCLIPHVSRVIGADINAELIAENVAKNTIGAITYEVQDACDFTYADGSFDAAVGMEIIEHIPLDSVDDFLGGIRRILKPEGVFICSTPQNSMGNIPVLPCHVKEYSLEEFKELLGKYFATMQIYGSKRGGPLTDDERGEKMLAVCHL